MNTTISVLIRKSALLLIIPLLLVTFGVHADQADPITIMSIENMGKEINSDGDEFYPTITANGRMMVFSLKPQNAQNSDIFVCYNTNGKWTRPEPFKELNSDSDDQTPFVSADGNIVLFSSNRNGTLRPPKKAGSVYFLTNDIYISYKTNGKWSAPEELPGEVNTADNERAPSLSKDSRTIYFSRYEGNSLEKSVIYYGTLDRNGFVDVRPMPEPINSGNSDFGFMPSNNKPGYYFSSSRQGGKGLWDIYYVHEYNGAFSEPINLGEPINSEFNDLTVTEIGNKIYFCSDRMGGEGSTDIYAITLSPKIFEVPDTGFKFRVLEKKSGSPVSATLKVLIFGPDDKDDTSAREVTKQSDGSGNFSVKVEPETSYVVVMSNEKNYQPYRMSFTPDAGMMKDDIIRLDVKEEAPVVSAKAQMRLPKVYFDFGSSRIKMKEMPAIHKVITRMRANPDLFIKITGHTDSIGGRPANMRLSRRRAAAVRDRMVRLGISRFRLKVEGKGKYEPSREFRNTGKNRYNRRVEFSAIDREEIDID